MLGQQFALSISLLVVLVGLSPVAVAFQQTCTSVSIIHRQQHRLHASYSSSPQEESTNDVSNTNDNNSFLQSRRNILLNVASNVALLSVVCTSSTTAANADVIRSAGCANGEGDACADLADGNEFIQSLQKKSAQNKEANQREALNAYYMKNYPDVFAVSDKRMVKRTDGTYALYSADEVSNLTKAGKITIEYPTSKGGRIADLTQKPILVLNE
jgi:hypothetical protein